LKPEEANNNDGNPTRRSVGKALQYLLTHSFSGKALAIRRVTENQGERTQASP